MNSADWRIAEIRCGAISHVPLVGHAEACPSWDKCDHGAHEIPNERDPKGQRNKGGMIQHSVRKE